MPVRPRIILRPERQSEPPIAVVASAIAVVGTRRKHQAGESPFGLLLPIRRQFEPSVFHAGLLPKGLLDGVQGAEEGRTACARADCLSDFHNGTSSRLSQPLPSGHGSLSLSRATTRSLCEDPSGGL